VEVSVRQLPFVLGQRSATSAPLLSELRGVELLAVVVAVVEVAVATVAK
jgi:hypothetical protein